MKTKKHILNDIWDQYPDVICKDFQPINKVKFEDVLSKIFTSGPFYFYALNITNSNIKHYNNDIIKIHGLKKPPKHLKEIIDLIHPDDVEFVRTAENWAFTKIKEIGYEKQQNYKTGYCFRMKISDGSYQMFHHQAIHTHIDEIGRLIQAVNIHTNIHHITQHNNYIATITGIGNNKDFHQFHFGETKNTEPIERLTKRELEVVILLSKGYTNVEISSLLHVSYHTIRTHRKNILKKTLTKNGSELVKKSIEMGYL